MTESTQDCVRSRFRRSLDRGIVALQALADRHSKCAARVAKRHMSDSGVLFDPEWVGHSDAAIELIICIEFLRDQLETAVPKIPKLPTRQIYIDSKGQS